MVDVAQPYLISASAPSTGGLPSRNSESECQQHGPDFASEARMRSADAWNTIQDRSVGLEEAPEEGRVNNWIVRLKDRRRNARYPALSCMAILRQPLSESCGLPPPGYPYRS